MKSIFGKRPETEERILISLATSEVGKVAQFTHPLSLVPQFLKEYTLKSEKFWKKAKEHLIKAKQYLDEII